MKRLLLALMLCGSQAVCPQDPQDNPLRVGFTASLIEDAGKNDAIASIEVWMEAIAKSSGWVHSHSEVEVVTSEGLLRQTTSQVGLYDILVLTPTEYVRLEGKIPFHQIFSGSRNGSSHIRYGLIVSKSTDAEDLAGLKGAGLTVGPGSRTLPMLWLESVLAKEGLPVIDEHFGIQRLEARAASAVMQVFLGQKEACLVPLDSYRTMNELNPQVGSALRIMETSPPLSRGIICVNTGLESEETAHIEEGLLRLDQNAAGRSLLQLFRVDKIVKFDVGHLKLVRQWIRPVQAKAGTKAGTP